MDIVKIAKAVQQRRCQLKLTREQLGVKAGLTSASVRNLELGRSPSLRTLNAIAEALNTTVENLARGAK